MDKIVLILVMETHVKWWTLQQLQVEENRVQAVKVKDKEVDREVKHNIYKWLWIQNFLHNLIQMQFKTRQEEYLISPHE